MCNICDFKIKAVGEESNINRLLECLKNEYHYIRGETQEKLDEELSKRYSLKYASKDGGSYLYANNDKHLYRIFECCATEKVKKDNNCYAVMSGDCANSVFVCMFEGPNSYYTDGLNSWIKDLAKEHATTVVQLSKDLDLKIEIYSNEPSFGMAEHYIVDKGKVIADEEYPFHLYYLADYETEEQAEEDLDIVLTDEERGSDWIFRCEINPINPIWHI